MSFYQNGILISGVNTLPELTRAQYEALPADKRPEYWVCLDEEYEPSSGGHTIEDASGTELTQRDVMQVLDGLEAVDDSTNQKTKIKMNLPIVSNADWNAMTEQEKTAYKASHYRFGVEVPDTEGVINAEYMKLLWENPNTTQAFAAQTVTLSSADYDFLLVIAQAVAGGATDVQQNCIFSKGHGCKLVGTSGNNVAQRNITYVSDTSVSVGDATVSGTTSNTYLVPIAIYGIKKNFQFKVNAIATDLSTSADHCFLSDDETSVEDKFGEVEEQIQTVDSKIGTAFYRTQVNVSLNTPVSGMSPFAYKGVSLEIVSSGNIEIVSCDVQTPSSGDWLFSTSFNDTTKKVTVYANGSATVLVRVIYRKLS